MKEILKKQAPLILLLIVTLLVFSPTIYLNSYVKLLNWRTDFNQHTLWAMNLKSEGMNGIPPYVTAHSGWHLLIIATNMVTGFSFKKSVFIVALLCAEATAIVMFSWFLPSFKRNNLPPWKLTAIILGLSIATPISVLWALDGLMYLGYIGITSYQSPTMYLLKPLALLQFILAYKCFTNSPSLGNREIVAAGIISFLSTFVKPVLSICLLPALGIFAIYNMTQKKYVNLRGLIFGFGLPIVLTLTWQFMVAYYLSDISGIAFAPFVVMGSYSKYLLAKFLLSILFPALILFFHFEQAKRDPRMILGWLIFAIGTFFTYFLSESGERILEGNFIWSGEIALFLLFAASTLFYLDMSPKKHLKSILQTSWILHIISGVVYYFYCMFNTSYW